jgi:hypothetical protein
MKTASDGIADMANYSGADYRSNVARSNGSTGMFQHLVSGAGVRRLRELFTAAPLSRLRLPQRQRMPPAYDEDTFHYLLDIEQKRSEIANRPCFVMLIDFDRGADGGTPLDVAAADQVFSIVAGCLRGSDVVGWYRRGSIAGAVLPQYRDVNPHDVSNLIAARVGAMLRQCLSRDLARSVQLKVWRVLPGAGARHN